MTAFLRPHSIPGIGTEPGEGTPMFFRLFPSVMIDRKRLCLSGGSSVRNFRAAGPLFYSRSVRLFSSSRSGEFVRFSDFCRVAGKGTGRLAGAPMRREPHAPPRPGVFRLRRLPSLRLRKTVLWVSSVRRSCRGLRLGRLPGASAACRAFFCRPRGAEKLPSFRLRGEKKWRFVPGVFP